MRSLVKRLFATFLIVTGGAVAVLVATAAGVSSSLGASASGGPFALIPGAEAGGYPLAGSGPSGTGVRFIDRGSFWIGVLLRNTSSERLTIVGARTPEPAGSLVGLVAARFAPFTPCSGHVACPFLADPRHPPAPPPLTVAPRRLAGVKLSYRLVSCAAARAATTASGDSLIVSYRAGTGPVQQQTFPLDGAKLLLHRPAGIECVPRPFSHIGLVGSFTTSPEHGTVPGSDGDTCTKTAGGALSFRSRLFMDRDQIEWRVLINLPRLRGLGTYGRAGSNDATLGQAEITASGGFGNHSWTTFHDNHGTVTLTEAKGARFGGRFEAVLSGHRRFFRAYGAWRCTTRF
jgi:hypothetical protein